MAVALDKELKPLLSDLKAENANAMQKAWHENHTTQRALMVGDVKVGTASFSPPKDKIVVRLGRENEALDKLKELGLVELTPVKGWQDHLVIHDGHVFNPFTGEEMCEFDVLAGRGVASVRGCDYETVSEALADSGLASSVAAGLLEEASYE